MVLGWRDRLSNPLQRDQSTISLKAGTGSPLMLLHTLRTQLDYFQRLLRNSIQKTPVESMIAVSSIRVRGAHGNSIEHLVGAQHER